MLAATVGDVRIVDLYVVNGEAVGSEKYDYKLRWLAAVRDWLAEELREHPDLVVLGDFNIAPDDRDVHDPKRWNDEDPVLHPRARGAAAACSTSACTTASACTTRRRRISAGGITGWRAFQRSLGLRIDLVLVSEALRARCTAAGIDREPRTWDRPSDHTPAWVELD